MYERTGLTGNPKLGRDELGEEGIFSVCPLALVLLVLLVVVVPLGNFLDLFVPVDTSDRRITI